MYLKKMLLIDSFLNALSAMSRTPLNYWAEFAIDIPFGVMLVVAGLHDNELGSIAVVLTILLGLLLFSIIEYAFHRWLFHGSVRIMEQGHRAHHVNPLGYDSLPFFLPVLIMMVLTGVCLLIMPAKIAFLLMGVITLSYVTYGLSHFIIHHHHFHNIIVRKWAANHHIHHYHDDTNFGVTTPLWDIVLGTRYKQRR